MVETLNFRYQQQNGLSERNKVKINDRHRFKQMNENGMRKTARAKKIKGERERKTHSSVTARIHTYLHTLRQRGRGQIIKKHEETLSLPYSKLYKI